MASKTSLRLMGIVLAVLVVVVAIACTGTNQSDDVDKTSGVTAAALSMEPAAPTSTSESAEPTPGTEGDAPEFPDVVVTEGPIDTPKVVPDDLKVIWEAWDFLNQDYVDKSQLDPQAFTENAIRGMLTVLGDPQTSYVSPDVLKGHFQDVFKGEFEGIGAHVQMNAAGKLLIVSPIEGGPADTAGIRSGDIILKVDGESLEGLSILEAVAKIRGPKGSTARLLVKHLGDIDPVEILVTRNIIPLVSVRLRSQPGDTFAHIRITDFYPNTVDELKEKLTEAVHGGAKGLILDLRMNGGGLLSAAVDTASQFLKDGLVLYVLDGNGRRTEYRVKKGGIATDLPMVVLVDGGSASGSEILAGALQDHKRAKLIGTTTYGKGSVNWLRELSNGGGLYITIAHWYTPLGRLIDREGIEPDIVVTDRDAREADVKQLKRAIQELELLTGISQSGDANS